MDLSLIRFRCFRSTGSRSLSAVLWKPPEKPEKKRSKNTAAAVNARIIWNKIMSKHTLLMIIFVVLFGLLLSLAAYKSGF
jgi:hypothetical protein